MIIGVATAPGSSAKALKYASDCSGTPGSLATGISLAAAKSMSNLFASWTNSLWCTGSRFSAMCTSSPCIAAAIFSYHTGPQSSRNDSNVR